VVSELRQQLLGSDQALAAAQQAVQRQQEEQQQLLARVSAVQGDCSRLQGQLEGQTAARRAAEDQVRVRV
jgi:Fe-S cluster assembly iron-binding protein IscA